MILFSFWNKLFLKILDITGLDPFVAIYFKYIFIAGMNTLFGYSVFAALVYFNLHYYLAIFIATIAGVLFNFKTLGSLVFNNRDLGLIWKFIGVYTFLYIINVVLISLFLKFVYNTYIANAIAIIFVGIVGFVLNKKIVFGTRGIFTIDEKKE